MVLLVDEIRQKIMKLMYKRRVKYRKWTDTLLPKTSTSMISVEAMELLVYVVLLTTLLKYVVQHLGMSWT